MSTKKESVTLEELLQYSYFPIIAEVDQDTRIVSSTSHTRKLQKGDLLWLLRYCQDEDTGKRAVRVCKFDAPNLEFPIVIGDSIKVFKLSYADIRHELDGVKGPLMDIGELAKLVEKGPGKDTGERPVFAVASDEQRNKTERILIHSKEKARGYLAQGSTGKYLMIPNSYNGPFAETKPTAAMKLPTFRKIVDIVKNKWLGEITVGYCTPVSDPQCEKLYKDDVLKLRDTSIRSRNGFSSGDHILFNRLKSTEGRVGDIRVSSMSHGLFLATKSTSESINSANTFILQDFKGTFPVQVSFTGVSSDPYFLSLDENTLRKESPLKVIGICMFSAIYTSTHQSDSSSTPFVSSQMYPDYSPVQVRAAAPLPLHIHAVKNYCKPVETVHVLNQDEYEILVKSVALSKPKISIVKRTTLYKSASTDDKPARPARSSVATMLGQELSSSKARPNRHSADETTRSTNRVRTWTTGGLKKQNRLDSDFDEAPPPPPKTQLGRRRSKSVSSAAEFLRRKHEMKNRPVPPPPPKKPSKDLSGGLPDLSSKTLPASMRNRPVPPPPTVTFSSELSDSMPDLREDDEDETDGRSLPVPHNPMGRRQSSLPDISALVDDDDAFEGEGEYEDDYMDMTTLVKIRMDLLNGT